MSVLSRRNILAATAAGGGLIATKAHALTGDPRSGTLATSNPGPNDGAAAATNPTAFAPPPTDGGNLGTLKYSFSQARNRRTNAGWAREVTVRNFPMSKGIAGVNMRLEAGAVRELHWHLPSEWAYMLTGSARITAVDPGGRHFVADVKQGDLWFFPSGIPHSIQGLGPDGCEFLLAFNDGNFSEDSTFLITDWMEHTPKDVLAKNFALPATAFGQIPRRELYIFNAPLPGPLKADMAESTQGVVPNRYDFQLMDVAPIATKGGAVRIADVKNFPASNVMCAALVEVEPGGMREMHWHPTADEWQYYISGTGQMTLFAGDGRANTIDFMKSDVGYVPRGLGHYVENIGQDTLRFLEIFNTGTYADVSLKDWMANTPHELVAAHLNMDIALLQQMNQVKTPVMPA